MYGHGRLTTTLRSLDLFPKTVEEFKERTFSGATISLLCVTAILALVIGEVRYYQGIDRNDELYVDTRPNGLVDIFLNITFHNIGCDMLSLDAADTFGDSQLNVQQDLQKRRLDPEGADMTQGQKSGAAGSERTAEQGQANLALEQVGAAGYCGSCFGAELLTGQCCNTCNEVKEAYRLRGWALSMDALPEQCLQEKQEREAQAEVKGGCNLVGTLHVGRVQGNFHFVPGRSYQHGAGHVHDFLPVEVDNFNITHTIHSLGFGLQYPGIVNPLDNKARIMGDQPALVHYFIKVVPTIFEHYGGAAVHTNQFSVTEFFKPRSDKHPDVIPGVFFIYDFSPILVHIREQKRHRSVLHFLSNLCAIVGGVFTVAGLVDRVWYAGWQALRKLAWGKGG